MLVAVTTMVIAALQQLVFYLLHSDMSCGICSFVNRRTGCLTSLAVPQSLCKTTKLGCYVKWVVLMKPDYHCLSCSNSLNAVLHKLYSTRKGLVECAIIFTRPWDFCACLPISVCAVPMGLCVCARLPWLLSALFCGLVSCLRKAWISLCVVFDWAHARSLNMAGHWHSLRAGTCWQSIEALGNAGFVSQPHTTLGSCGCSIVQHCKSWKLYRLPYLCFVPRGLVADVFGIWECFPNHWGQHCANWIWFVHLLFTVVRLV